MRNTLMIDKGKVMEGKSSINWKCAMLSNVALCVCVCVCVCHRFLTYGLDRITK